MLIKTDFRSIFPFKPPTVRDAANFAALGHGRETARISTKSINNRLSIDRSLSDALSIAQMSQNVIQRAMSISLRLKSIASDAIFSGRINTQALTETLSDIRSALGDYGEPVPNPVQPFAMRSVKIVEMPDISREIKSLRDITRNLQNGDFAQTGRIEAVSRSLNDKLKAFKASEEKITDVLQTTTAGYDSGQQTHIPELTSRVRAVIEASPGLALTAQGNISHATASRFIV